MQLVAQFRTRALAGVFLPVLLVFHAHAATTNIAGLYATGAGGSNGLPDLNWKLIEAPTGVPTNALIASIIPSSWMPAPTGSKWLSPFNNANFSAPAGSYVYELTFDLVDSGGNSLDPLTASLSGHFAADDWVEISLNGNVIATAPNTTSLNGFGQLFSFNANSGFVEGLNVLTFDVRNIGGPDCGPSPTGLLVTDFCTSASVVLVPEPGTWTLLSLGLGGMALASRRMKRRTSV